MLVLKKMHRLWSLGSLTGFIFLFAQGHSQRALLRWDNSLNNLTSLFCSRIAFCRRWRL